jgi:hypothetical protein
LQILCFEGNVAKGTAEPWKDLITSDAAGLLDIGPILFTPDGKSYADSYSRTLSDLYYVQGLK